MAIDAGLLMAGLTPSQVSVAMSDAVKGTPPHLAIVNDGSFTFERVALHQYRGGFPADQAFDEIGKDISVSIESSSAGHLSAVSNLRIRASLGKANAALLAPVDVLTHDPILRTTASSLLGTDKYVYVYGSGITLEQVGSALDLTLPDHLVGKAQRLHSVIGIAVGREGLRVRYGPALNLDSEVLREEALRWAITWELTAWNESR